MATVKNADIAGLAARILRFRKELVESQSAGVASMTGADKVRLRSYLSLAQNYRAWVSSMPTLDLPKSHPKAILVADVPSDPDAIENEDVVDIVRLLDSLYVELTSSQSADLASGLVEYDAKRFDDIVQKVVNFLDNFVDVSTPLDLPESATSPDV